MGEVVKKPAAPGIPYWTTSVYTPVPDVGNQLQIIGQASSIGGFTGFSGGVSLYPLSYSVFQLQDPAPTGGTVTFTEKFIIPGNSNLNSGIGSLNAYQEDIRDLRIGWTTIGPNQIELVLHFTWHTTSAQILTVTFYQIGI